MACICREIAGKDLSLSSVCIGHHWIFADLDHEELEFLVQGAIRRRYIVGEAIFFQGDPAREMFLIKAGRVKLSKFLEDGMEITLDIRKTGDFLGENMFNEEGSYPVTATCMEATMICGFTKERFEQLVLDHPNMGLQVIKNLSKRISSLTSRVAGMTIANLAKRLHAVLVHVAREHGTPHHRGFSIPFPLTHEDLSFLVGAHRVSITRAMKELRDAGRIIQEGNRLTIFENSGVRQDE